MFKFTHSAARTIATAALFGSVVLYGPFAIAAGVFAGSASTVQSGSALEILTQASASPATTEPAPAPGTAEARILSRLTSRNCITNSTSRPPSKLNGIA